ncbi:hypothetical protein OIDMADRAFT_16357 [Oidiodendron maius Zn]|uniref:Uncharacterized protein n=1 Tax=Oidiodendron maius (strain Zn) TaxID=913774 RepID=A0A0C3I075_OIDMZ|nr:hypothetical protein OIDMADRAFT_16357 [Oidiodendron maius Zn]
MSVLCMQVSRQPGFTRSELIKSNQISGLKPNLEVYEKPYVLATEEANISVAAKCMAPCVSHVPIA